MRASRVRGAVLGGRFRARVGIREALVGLIAGASAPAQDPRSRGGYPARSLTPVNAFADAMADTAAATVRTFGCNGLDGALECRRSWVHPAKCAWVCRSRCRRRPVCPGGPPGTRVLALLTQSRLRPKFQPPSPARRQQTGKERAHLIGKRFQ